MRLLSLSMKRVSQWTNQYKKILNFIKNTYKIPTQICIYHTITESNRAIFESNHARSSSSMAPGPHNQING